MEAGSLRNLWIHAEQIDFLPIWRDRKNRLAGGWKELVLKQHDRLGLRGLSLPHELCVTGDHASLALIHIGLLEQAKREFLPQDAAGGFTHACFGYGAGMNVLYDEIRFFGPANLIHSRIDGFGEAFPFVRSSTPQGIPMSRGVGLVPEGAPLPARRRASRS